MLQLTKIRKSYKTGNFTQEALKDVSLNFRESEFVAILGTSGSGKTTLLNIIGGLDRYDSGDLIINGKSTKKFKDSEWDAYRNNSIGFIFQNYNLIGHISVLANVEMCMTLSGVSAKEKKRRATKVLEKVGLKEHINKKPNQLSGGQMQRVAIARALVNNPDIILADEPTGALDSNTSVQIMELITEIAKDKLVIMVTHNPELAEEYANRIIQIKDGEVQSDTNPLETEQIQESKYKLKKTSMNFFTALKLSFTNIWTKKGRTILTAFAGSIGIIGIALILSLSNGVQEYVKTIEQDTLSSYPVTIEKTSMNSNAMLGMMAQDTSKTSTQHDKNKVYSNNIMSEMISMMTDGTKINDLKSFKQYLESSENEIKQYANAIQYNYGITLNVYKNDISKGVYQVNPSKMLENIGMEKMAASPFSKPNVWFEMIDNKELLKTQYDVIAGQWPENYNEVAIIVNENNEISDYTLYTLGLADQSEVVNMVTSMYTGEKKESKPEVKSYSYENILGTTYKVLLGTDKYQKENGIWVDKSKDEKFMAQKIANGVDVKIVGIIRLNSESLATSMEEGIYYNKELTKYIVNQTNNTQMAKEQIENKNLDILTGKEFGTGKLANYELNAEKMGIADLEEPKEINIYPKDFESKDKIAEVIKKYNEKQKNEGHEDRVIEYTDLVGVLMNSVTVIVDMISYVLIAFVAISLIVSSIMIGIITYISVLERTKEIGVLRAIGARKKDITRVFNAETIIIGFTSGLFGILITMILLIPINAIIKSLANVSNLASLPIAGGIALVLISMFLTLIAGLIPAKVAAKKDPVNALRTE